jgi:hypothetical protein
LSDACYLGDTVTSGTTLLRLPAPKLELSQMQAAG